MSTVKEPTVKAPWPPQPKNDKFFRFPKEYPVGKERGESWTTIAKKHAVIATDLVYYVFLTKHTDEINWYLASYVGCPAPKPPEKYYGFFGAARDKKRNTGVIYVPMFGESVADHLNRLGEKVVENYNQSHNKEPGGACFEICYARVKDAGRHVGTVLPPLDRTSVFGRLWGSYIDPKKTWLDLPEQYRGKGAAGAMAYGCHQRGQDSLNSPVATKQRLLPPLFFPETMHLSHFQLTHFQLTIWWRYSHGIRRKSKGSGLNGTAVCVP